MWTDPGVALISRLDFPLTTGSVNKLISCRVLQYLLMSMLVRECCHKQGFFFFLTRLKMAFPPVKTSISFQKVLNRVVGHGTYKELYKKKTTLTQQKLSKTNKNQKNKLGLSWINCSWFLRARFPPLGKTQTWKGIGLEVFRLAWGSVVSYSLLSFKHLMLKINLTSSQASRLLGITNGSLCSNRCLGPVICWSP